MIKKPIIQYFHSSPVNNNYGPQLYFKKLTTVKINKTVNVYPFITASLCKILFNNQNILLIKYFQLKKYSKKLFSFKKSLTKTQTSIFRIR